MSTQQTQRKRTNQNLKNQQKQQPKNRLHIKAKLNLTIMAAKVALAVAAD
jgi:hypothetical protein